MTMLLLALLGTAQAAAPRTPPLAHGRYIARPRANLASYVTSNDYPRDAIRAGQEGTTGFKLTIGPDGRVTSCVIEKSSGSASLDSTTCRIMASRARFEPALDAAGKPTSDTMSARITWRLPMRQTIPDLVVSSFSLAPDGTPSDCQMEVTMGGQVGRRAAPDCGATLSAQPYFEAIKKAANGTATRVTMEVRLIRDAAAPWPDLDGPGRRVISRELARLQVSQGGQVMGCSVLDYRPLPGPTVRACSVVGSRIGQYEVPGDSEMRMVVTTALADGPKR
ncbi:TonB family protein [Sphingomonas kaistensis]|uniref:TonB family protein n=1 Tax=Sphingomonas kaistensis TaxID=298708 RepID=A0A7X5Y9F8_9SPHN|nr:energy transducer TonB [Sphingomonas kaistensis]NJC06992.1 TonB family protein [Sphingomonas kaistensis]